MSNQGFKSKSGIYSTILRKHIDMPHVAAFRARIRELRALSRSAFVQAGAAGGEPPGRSPVSGPDRNRNRGSS